MTTTEDAEATVPTRRERGEQRAALQDAIRATFVRDPNYLATAEQRRLLIDADAASIADAVLDEVLSTTP